MAGEAPESGPAMSSEMSSQTRRVDGDAALREMRHRFRNSLQFLNSLVGLHARRTTDQQARDAFKDLRARLVTLSWIYDELDRGQEADVPLAEFLPRLAHHLAGMHGSEARRDLAFDLADVRVGTDRAVTIGQILTELLAGIYARAAASARCTIEIKLVAEDAGRCRLEIAEVGAAALGKHAPVDQLGIVVVKSLAMNLDGSFEDNRDTGGEAVLRFDAGLARGERQA